MNQSQRLLIFGLSIAAVTLFDFLKFYIVGESNIINWRSFIHPFWVVVAFASLFIYAKFQTADFRRFFFALYLGVFSASFLNQFTHFSKSLTYECMLFNLIFAAIFFFSSPVEEG